MFGLLSSTRSFAGYHSLWTHTQNRAVVHLISYAHSGDQNEYIQFERNLNIMDGIQNALYELNMDEPDATIVESNLLTSSLYTDEIREKIQHLHFLRRFEKFKNAFDKWEDYHQNSEHLREIAFSIRNQLESEEMDEFSLEQLLFLAQNLNILLIDDQIELLQDLESASLSVKNYSILVLMILTSGVFFIGGVITYLWYKNTNRLRSVSEEKNRIASFPKMNPNPIMVMDQNGECSYMNEAAHNVLGKHIDVGSDSDIIRLLRKTVEQMVSDNEETKTIEASIGEKYFFINAFKLRKKPAIHFYFVDNTNKKKLELNLYQTLEEKNVLLSEVHHRVKNNLAIAISLLEVERLDANNIATDRIITRSISRLHSIAAIHEQLYNYQNLTKIDLIKFFNQIINIGQSQCNNLNLNYANPQSCNGDFININQAVPCSMLLNQIFSIVNDNLCSSDKPTDLTVRVYCENSELRIGINSQILSTDKFQSLLKNDVLVSLFKEQLSAFFNINTKQNDILISFQLSDKKGSSNSLPEDYKPSYGNYQNPYLTDTV